jgi:8-oxo-dGTP diphosphatase
MADIRKAMAVLIQDRKVLVSRTKGKDFFIGPGGKVEPGESDMEAMVRELKEELQIEVDPANLEDFGTFEAQAAGNEQKTVSAHVFVVTKWDGAISPANEIEEIVWIGSEIPPAMTLGSIFAHDVLPRLKSLNLID